MFRTPRAAPRQSVRLHLGNPGGSFPQPGGSIAPEPPGTPSPVTSVSLSGARTASGPPGPRLRQRSWRPRRRVVTAESGPAQRLPPPAAGPLRFVVCPACSAARRQQSLDRFRVWGLGLRALGSGCCARRSAAIEVLLPGEVSLHIHIIFIRHGSSSWRSAFPGLL